MVLLIGIAMGVSILLSAVVPAEHDTGLDIRGWGLSLGIALSIGTVMFLLGKLKGKAQTMRRREAMALVGVGWFVCSWVAALPYIFCDPHVSWDFAFFEGVSGLTTTGASIFVELETLPKSILMWRSVTQWLGGMGILAMFVVVLSGMIQSSKTLIGAESSLSNSDLSSLRQTMRWLWAVYLVFTLVCGLGLLGMGLTPFQAVNHALTAVSTGGFSTETSSVSGGIFHPAMKVWLLVFMLLGAISFPFYLSILKGKWVSLRQNFEEVYWFLGIFAIASTLLLVAFYAGFQPGAEPVDLIFNVASVMTSTGYVSSDFGEWSRLGLGVLILLMIIGGCSGSTAGGLKVSRILFWCRFLRSGFVRSFRPKVVNPIKLNGRKIQENSVEQLFMVISLFGFFTIVGVLCIQLLEPTQSFLGSVSAVISCLGNIGPALADMGGVDSFAEVRPASKIVFAGLMVLGRLEYVAFLVLFSRQLWRKY